MSSVLASSRSNNYSFSVEAFEQKSFDERKFLEDCQLRAPLQTIHDQLGDYLQHLEKQLVEIINRDYVGFLQLSSNLIGVDTTISSIKASILSVRDRVQTVKDATESILTQVETDLSKKNEFGRKRHELQQSLRVCEKIELMEKLLSINDPADDSPVEDPSEDLGPDFDDGYSNFTCVYPSENSPEATLSATNQQYECLKSIGSHDIETCVTLERVARGLELLQFEMVAGGDNYYIQVQSDRVVRIEEVLLQRLEEEIATELVPDSFYHRKHTINLNAILCILRCYALLNKPHVVEDLIGRLVLQPFIDETFTKNRLDGGLRGSCRGLEDICSSTIDFIRDHLGQLLMKLDPSNPTNECSQYSQEVDLLGNGLWKPIKEAFFVRLKTIFTPGNIEKFQSNYTCCMNFLSDLEKFCPTQAQKKRFRNHEAVVEFSNQWNLQAYVQLFCKDVLKEISSCYETEKNTVNMPDSNKEIEPTTFKLHTTEVVWSNLLKCWSSSVFLSPVEGSLMRLCLQLLQTYIDLYRPSLESILASISSTNLSKSQSIDSIVEKSTGSIRSSEVVYRLCEDSCILGEKIKEELLPQIHACVRNDLTLEQDTEFSAVIKQLFAEPLEELGQISEHCLDIIKKIIIEGSSRILPAVRTIKNQFQMTNKPLPTVFSNFVPNILMPLDNFLSEYEQLFSSKSSTRKRDFVAGILSSILGSYHQIVVELLKAARTLEESLKSRRIRKTAAGSSETEISDTEKMAFQIFLDLKEFQRIAEGWGILRLEEVEEFGALSREVSDVEKYAP